ncbi:MAG: hypothetical protein Q9178_004204 [Gyalolechia marmorata]
MIALSQHLQSHGYTPSEHEHTRISGIWKKLDSLYNLEALNDRENAWSRTSSPDAEESVKSSYEFRLPEDDYGHMMVDRRLAPAGSSSPPASTRPPSAGSTSRAATGRASTIEDTEDVRSSPASVRGAKAIGSARQTRSTRRSQLHEVSSLPERKGGSKISPKEDSIDAPDEEEAEAPGNAGEEEQQDRAKKMNWSSAEQLPLLRRRKTLLGITIQYFKTVNGGRRDHAHVMEDLVTNGDAFEIPDFWQQSSLGPIEVPGGLSELDPDLNSCLESFDQGLVELPTFDIPGEDPLQISKCLAGDQYGEAPFGYGPLEYFEPLELSPASSASSEEGDHGDPDNILDDFWSAKEILEPIASQIRVRGWERMHDISSKEPLCAYINETGPRIFDGAPDYAAISDQPPPALQPDAVLSSLVQLAFGRESMIYRYDDKERSFEPVVEGIQVSGYTPQILRGLTTSVASYGSKVRKAKDFFEMMQRSSGATASSIALGSGVNIILQALEAHLSAPLSSVKTVVQLQALLEQPTLVLESILSIVDKVSKVEDDDIILSKLFGYSQNLEFSAPQLQPLMSQLLAHVSKPWLETVEASTGLKGVQILGISSMKIRAHVPNGYRSRIAVDSSIEAEDDPPQRMPVFIGTDLSDTLWEAEDSLKLLQAHEPEHPLAQPRIIASYEPPSLQWQFSWQDIKRVEAQAQAYESNVLQGLKEFHKSGVISHQVFEEQPEFMVQGPVSTEVFDLLLDLDSPVSNLLTNVHSPLATTVHEALSKRPSPSPSVTTPSMSVLPTLAFASILLTQARLLSHSTLHLLFHTHSIRSHLRLLESYLLVANGPFLAQLSHALFEPTLSSAAYQREYIGSNNESKRTQLGVRETWPPRSSELRIVLMEILTESYHSSSESGLAACCQEAGMDQAELPGGLSFAIRNDMSDVELEKCVDSDGLEALDYLKIQYRPLKPLDVVITDRVLEKYDRVNRLLLRGARIAWVAKDMLKQHRGNGGSMLGSRLVQRFKIEVHHFVTTVFGYFGNCIRELWTAFEMRLDGMEASIECYEVGQKVEGAHRLRELHEEVLDWILATSILRKRQELVMNLLTEILGLVLQLAKVVRQTKGDEEGQVRDMYEIWKKKVKGFITVCRELQDEESLAGKKEVFDGGELGKEKGNGIGRLVLSLEMNGWYMR